MATLKSHFCSRLFLTTEWQINEKQKTTTTDDQSWQTREKKSIKQRASLKWSGGGREQQNGIKIDEDDNENITKTTKNTDGTANGVLFASKTDNSSQFLNIATNWWVIYMRI